MDKYSSSECNALLPFKAHCICILDPDNTGDDVYRHGQVQCISGVWGVPLRPRCNKKYAEVHQRNIYVSFLHCCSCRLVAFSRLDLLYS